MFNWSEFHFSQLTSYKIHTLKGFQSKDLDLLQFEFSSASKLRKFQIRDKSVPVNALAFGSNANNKFKVTISFVMTNQMTVEFFKTCWSWIYRPFSFPYLMSCVAHALILKIWLPNNRPTLMIFKLD